MHAWGYATAVRANSDATLIGLWDPEPERARGFAKAFACRAFPEPEALLAEVDAVIVTSENRLHAGHVQLAAARGRHVLCEKPLVTSESEWALMKAAVDRAGTKLMTAFPSRYSPAFQRLKQRVGAGDVGPVVAICATNRGRCPFGWFVETEKSGGGAMIDHVVHVADLLWVLLGQEPTRVQAQTGNKVHGEAWEDTAMLTLEYAGGRFATLDSSWSRPKSYKTWGDVTMNVVGESGVIEMDMFSQQIALFDDGSMSHSLAEYGSDLDAMLVADFVECIESDTSPPITGEDGWRASRVALAGYESARTGAPVATTG